MTLCVLVDGPAGSLSVDEMSNEAKRSRIESRVACSLP